MLPNRVINLAKVSFRHAPTELDTLTGQFRMPLRTEQRRVPTIDMFFLQSGLLVGEIIQVAQHVHLRPFPGSLVWIILREDKDHRSHVAVDGFPLFEM
jgi:hypothetical protein